MLGSYQQNLHDEHKKRRSKFFPTTRPPQASKPEKVQAVPTLDEIFPKAYRVWINKHPIRLTGRVLITDVLSSVCKAFGVELVDLIGEQRFKKIMYPRQIAMYLCATMTGRSFPEIGRRMGGRDHTTIMHGKEKIKAQLDYDEKLRADIQLVKFQMGAA